MRLSARIPLPILGGLVLLALGCNVQPGDRGASPPARGEPTLKPEPGAPVAARPAPSPPASPRLAPKPAVAARPAAPTGPRATTAAPLPPADRRIAIFHSGNVEGELDPCG